MKPISRILLPAVVLMVSASLTQAQSQPDHQAHHPAGQDSAQAAPSTLPNQPEGGMPGMMGGMMGQGGMMPMMQGMMGRPDGQGGMMPMSCPMMAQGGMSAMGSMGMPFERIEGRIAFLEAELGITDAQTKEWNAFADALRTNAEAMRTAHEHMIRVGQAATFTESLDHREKVLAARLDAIRELNAAADPLFAVLSDEQKETASNLLGGLLGMM